jgi:hypothetical protein
MLIKICDSLLEIRLVDGFVTDKGFYVVNPGGVSKCFEQNY